MSVPHGSGRGFYASTAALVEALTSPQAVDDLGSALATELVLSLLPVLDDIDRADAHGELVGAARTIATSLRQTVTEFGLQRFGNPGDPYEPARHQSVLQVHDPCVLTPVCELVTVCGYQFGEQILRKAHVIVALPAPPPGR